MRKGAHLVVLRIPLRNEATPICQILMFWFEHENLALKSRSIGTVNRYMQIYKMQTVQSIKLSSLRPA